jgi:hypothetical protein
VREVNRSQAEACCELWNRDHPAAVPHAVKTTQKACLAMLSVLVFGACSPAASLPLGSPTPVGATPTPTARTGIEHPTGAKDVILRFEEGGGFVPVDFFVTQAPSFTLYGDGTAIFRDAFANQPEPFGDVIRSVPFMAIRLAEDQVQAMLEFALGPGGLALATGPYMGPGADLPTATFTISLGSQTKSVSVTGLGLDWQGADAIIVAALGRLAERLRGFGNDVVGEQVWTPERYRGVLQPADQPVANAVAWPWPDIEPTEFVKLEGEDAPRLPVRTMSPAEVAQLGIPGFEGGLQNLVLQDPARKQYTFALRPLLPDEQR